MCMKEDNPGLKYFKGDNVNLHTVLVFSLKQPMQRNLLRFQYYLVLGYSVNRNTIEHLLFSLE